ncbi:MAG: hypothetical protein V7646_4939 [Pseudonocardia sp.]
MAGETFAKHGDAEQDGDDGIERGQDDGNCDQLRPGGEQVADEPPMKSDRP